MNSRLTPLTSQECVCLLLRWLLLITILWNRCQDSVQQKCAVDHVSQFGDLEDTNSNSNQSSVLEHCFTNVQSKSQKPKSSSKNNQSTKISMRTVQISQKVQKSQQKLADQKSKWEHYCSQIRVRPKNQGKSNNRQMMGVVAIISVRPKLGWSKVEICFGGDYNTCSRYQNPLGSAWSGTIPPIHLPSYFHTHQ